MNSPTEQTYLYDAFISYSRKDEAFARRLEAYLERYRAPKSLGKARKLNIFRDVQDLVGNELSVGITRAIESSCHLIVVCSPNARRSKWVGKEIEAFATFHGKGGILPVLVAGRPNFEVNTEDEHQDQALPDALYRYLDEPLAADFRRSVAKGIFKRRARQREAKFQILASLLDVEKETLIHRQRMRTFQRWAIASILFIFSVIAFTLVFQDARKKNLIAKSRRLTIDAQDRLDKHLDLALLLGLEALQTYNGAEARSGLLTGLQHNPNLIEFLHGDGNAVTDLALSFDGQLLVSSSFDSSVINLWDVKAGRLLKRLEMNSPLNKVMLTTDNKYLVTLDKKGMLVLRNLSKPEAAEQILGIGRAKSFVVSPDGQLLAVFEQRGRVTVWSLSEQRILARLRPGPDVKEMAFHPSGRKLATLKVNLRRDITSLIVWDLTNGQFEKQTLNNYRASSIAYRSSGELIAAAPQNLVIVWEVGSKKPPINLTAGYQGPLGQILFNQNAQWLAAVTEEGDILLWNLIEVQSPARFIQMKEPGTSILAFCPKGMHLLSGCWDGTIGVFWLEPPPPLGIPLDGHKTGVWALAFSPDGKFIASGEQGGRVVLWDLVKQQRSGFEYATKAKDILSLAFASNDYQLLSVGLDRSLEIWDIANHKLLRHEYIESDNKIKEPVLSPDGSLLAWGNAQGAVTLLDIKSKQRRVLPKPHNEHVTEALSFSSNGELLASGYKDGAIAIWDVKAERLLKEWNTDLPNEVSLLAVSQAGKRLAYGSMVGSVRLADMMSLKEIGREITGDRTGIWSISFSPGGTLLAAGTSDGEITLYDTATGKSLGKPMEKHRSDVGSLTFSKPGTLMASGDGDGGLVVWDMSFLSWQARTCRIANRNLSQIEWNEFIGANTSYFRTCSEFPSGKGAPQNAPARQYVDF